MKIKFLARSASAEGNFIVGEVADLPVDFARALVDGGYADLVGKPEPETATAEPAQEKAVIKKPKRKPRAKAKPKAMSKRK